MCTEIAQNLSSLAISWKTFPLSVVMKIPFSCLISSLSFNASKYFFAILKFKFTSYTIWVFFAPFIVTLKISTAISVLLLLLILIPPKFVKKSSLQKA